MSDRDNHGMNCAHRSDSDEPCTCACRHHAAVDTERTMHAAWRKRAEQAERENADLRSRMAEAEKARDSQAKVLKIVSKTCDDYGAAVRVLARDLYELAIEARNNIDTGEQTYKWPDWIDEAVWNNPTAAAAVKEASK